ncbi:hypothetical protein COOONC_02748 [Cooperia oncophora]
MSGKGECSAWGGKSAWGRKEEDCEPIVSFVEIMSEDLAETLNEEERRKEQEFLQAIAESEATPFCLTVLSNCADHIPSATVTVTPDRYYPKTAQDSDISSDDEDARQFVTDLLYAKLTDDAPTHSSPVFRNSGGDMVTKHDANASARRNADKAMNRSF